MFNFMDLHKSSWVTGTEVCAEILSGTGGSRTESPTHPELLSRFLPAPITKHFWECEMSSVPGVTGKLFKAQSGNERVWQMIKPGLCISCLQISSSQWILGCFMLCHVALSLCSTCCFWRCWSSLLRGGFQRWSWCLKMIGLCCTLNLNLKYLSFTLISVCLVYMDFYKSGLGACFTSWWARGWLNLNWEY